MISKDRLEELIREHQIDIGCFEQMNNEHKEHNIGVCEDTISILQSELERQNGCEYCNEKNSKRIEAEIYKGDNITIEKYEDYCLDIEFWENDVKATGLVKIQYCPMCGRKLGGE